MTLHINADTLLPECERCMAHWYAMKPRPANPAAYFERLHVMEGHR